MQSTLIDYAEVRGLTARALDLTRQALLVLDQAGAPSDIGAHLDHAAVRLEGILGGLEAVS